MKRSSRVRRRWLRLPRAFAPRVAAPLLLLLPLGALGVVRWRVMHPPLSALDRELRAALKGASGVVVTAYGTPGQQLTGLAKPYAVFGMTRPELEEFAETLRCADQSVKPDYDFGQDPALVILVGKIVVEEGEQHLTGTPFRYWRTRHGSYFAHVGKDGELIQCAQVRPAFVPRFEAFARRIAQRPTAVLEQEVRNSISSS